MARACLGNDRFSILLGALLVVGLFFLGVANTKAISNFTIYASIFGAILFFWRDFLRFDIRLFRPIFAIFALYFLLSILSLFWSIDPRLSLNEIRSEILQNLLLFFGAFLLASHFSCCVWRYFLYVLVLAFALHGVAGILIWLLDGGFPTRGSGLLGNIEGYGIWVLWLFGFSLAFILLGKSRFYTWIGVLLLGVAILAMVANHTRATWLGGIAIVCALVFLLHGKIERLVALASGAIVVLVVTSFLYFCGENLGQRYDLKLHINEISQALKLPPSRIYEVKEQGFDEAISSRLAMWKSIYLALKKDPLTPRGLGRELYARSIVYEWSGMYFDSSIDAKRWLEENQKVSHIAQNGRLENIPYALYIFPHNSYLGMAYQLGIFGLLTMIAWFLLMSKYALGLVHGSDRVFSILGAGYFLGIIGFSVAIFFADFFVDGEARLFYILSGVIFAMRYRSER
ncbi:MAG: O-antigen ligase family protein [Wolinella sp.]